MRGKIVSPAGEKKKDVQGGIQVNTTAGRMAPSSPLLNYVPLISLLRLRSRFPPVYYIRKRYAASADFHTVLLHVKQTDP